MASLHKDNKSPNFSIRFRYQGRNVNRSLGTGDKRKASGICSRVEETLRLLESSRIEIPLGADSIEFILSDGKTTEKVKTPKKDLGLTKFFTPTGDTATRHLHGKTQCRCSIIAVSPVGVKNYVAMQCLRNVTVMTDSRVIVWIQNPVTARSWGFKSPLRYSTKQGVFCCPLQFGKKSQLRMVLKWSLFWVTRLAFQ